MIPKIDYKLLGEAVAFYESIGYRYVEVPWVVEECFIRATLPETFGFMELGIKPSYTPLGPQALDRVYNGENALVGSAEQGFLALQLDPGRYVGITPCFRLEGHNDLFYQDTFMKVELFDTLPDTTVEQVIKDAETFHRGHLNPLLLGRDVLRRVETGEGIDLQIGGVEVGSYGERTHEDYGRWVYGTGLACPRFSVARALAEVV